MDDTSHGVGLGDAMLLAQRNNDNWGNGGCFWIWIFLFFFLMGGNGAWGNNNGEMQAAKTQATIWQANDAQSMQQQIRGLAGGINDATYSLNNGIQGINQNLAGGFFGVQRDMLQGNFGIQNGINNQTYQLGQALNGIQAGIAHGNNDIQREIMQGFNNTQVQNLQGMGNIAQLMNENRFTIEHGTNVLSNGLDGIKYDNAMNVCRITTNSTENTQKILDKLSAMEMNAKDSEIANLRAQLSQANLTVSQYDQNATLVNAIRPFPSPSYIVSSPYGTTNPYANA